jgi:uncharacterized protein YaaR (DUF327 family)
MSSAGSSAVPAPESTEEVEVGVGLTNPGISGVDAPTEKLFDAVHTAGQRLLDQRTYSAAQAYREAVRRFLRKVLPTANGVEIQESGYGILSRKRYYLLTSINRSVDRLLTGLMQTQGEQFAMLQRLEEIQGMLIDLTH